uniref:Uncharacterized protein n=1 Tax=Pipistrellus kuhlii TaxID=59472 RepID=A0A7J7RU70_PIPKU|nr:hypothetical protein mPipKuh1_010242 [Pipistrellus kuhlii]
MAVSTYPNGRHVPGPRASRRAPAPCGQREHEVGIQHRPNALSPGTTTAPAVQGPSQRFLSSRHSVQVCERLSSRRRPPAPRAIAILSFTKPGGSLEAWRPWPSHPISSLPHPPQTGVTQTTT